MFAERPVDPAISQALEEVQQRLRTEQLALAAQPLERARLREELRLLQAERDSIHQQLEALQRGLSQRASWSPTSMSFEVRPRTGPYSHWRRPLALLLVMAAVTDLRLATGDNPWMPFILTLQLLTALAVLLVWSSGPSAAWSFTERAINIPGEPLPVPYTDVLKVEARSTDAQRRHGIGTVIVTCMRTQKQPAVKVHILENASEPERLAEWIRSKRS